MITSPEKRCGKTRLLDIIGGTCHRPLATVDATVAAIFRSLGGDHPPTLVIDEADAIFGNKKVAENNEDLRKLLNAGHQRGKPAIRCVGPMQIPTPFVRFAMAALAGIGAMPDTITDRAINISMRRRAHGEKVAQFRSRRDGPILGGLRDRLAAWTAAHIEEEERGTGDAGGGPRRRHLGAADRGRGRCRRSLARRGAGGVQGVGGRADEADEDRSLSVKLLADIRQVFTEKCAPFLSSADLVAELRRIEDSPWSEFELTARKLAYRLKKLRRQT